MEEVSLLTDAVSRLNEPFLLAIVGEFNSGKSTVINALLGNRYLSEGVIPTTNEITFLRYSDLKSVGSQRCERNVDGQYVCFLPAPILKEMNMVDTPGTNVILRRQQRLTEEFVPRADLLLFVLSADRPLTESEVTFLQYIQQWKKRIVFVLNKSDIYQNARELEEAISFIKENAKKLLNTEHITIYPVSARATLEGKLGPLSCRTGSGLLTNKNPSWKFNTFLELEEFLHSFLDSSTSNGMERIRLKLETPVAIAERLLSSCEKLVRQDSQRMKQNLTSIKDLVSSVAEYAAKMDGQSISYRRQIISLIDTTKSRILEQVESTVQLSNFDTVASYLFKGEKSSMMPITSKVLNDIIGPALSDTQKLLEDYVVWLKSNNTREGRLYKEAFEERWQSLANPVTELHLDAYEMLKEVDELSLRAMSNFNAVATSKSLEREIREVFLGTFGGLGAAGLSASLLTSVLPTTLEDLLALGISSAGGLLAISRFPAQRRELEEKVKKAADALASDLEEAMEKDLLQAIGNLENFVKTISKPYEDVAQNRLDKLLEIQDGLSNIQKELQTLQIEIQNFNVS